MKPRETRHRIVVPARLNRDGQWADVRIRNVSSRGLGLESSQPLRRGTFVEVRSGRNVIVGYVVWSDGARVGLRAQDRIDVLAFLGGTAARAAIHAGNPDALAGARRDGRTSRAPQYAEQAERSRFVGRRIQFAATLGIMGCAGTAVASLVATTLSSFAEAASLGLAGG